MKQILIYNRVLVVAVLFLIRLLTGAGELRGAEYESRIFRDSSGQSIPYRLLKPEQSDRSIPLPVVLFFHGAGERGNDNEKQLIHGARLFLTPDARLNFPCFVIAPQCPENQQWVNMPWSTESGLRPTDLSNSMRLALGALDEITREFSIDTNRIYVTGLSMGGFATWDCISRFPRRFAAGIPICGGGDPNSITVDVARVPIWAFHSDDDSAVRVERTRELVATLHHNGGRPVYFEDHGLGHNCWDRAYRDPQLLPWLFAQRLGKLDNFQVQPPRK